MAAIGTVRRSGTRLSPLWLPPQVVLYPFPHHEYGRSTVGCDRRLHHRRHCFRGDLHAYRETPRPVARARRGVPGRLVLEHPAHLCCVFAGTRQRYRDAVVGGNRGSCRCPRQSLACGAVAPPLFVALPMEAIVNAAVTGITAACVLFVLYIAFSPRAKDEQPKTKRLRQCPTCKRWQEVS